MAYTLSSTSTEWPAHSATGVGGTPPLSQVDTQAVLGLAQDHALAPGQVGDGALVSCSFGPTLRGGSLVGSGEVGFEQRVPVWA